MTLKFDFEEPTKVRAIEAPLFFARIFCNVILFIIWLLLLFRRALILFYLICLLRKQKTLFALAYVVECYGTNNATEFISVVAVGFFFSFFAIAFSSHVMLLTPY